METHLPGSAFARWMIAIVTLQLAIGWLASIATAAEFRVESPKQIKGLTGQLQPGDVVVMANGTWKDKSIAFRGKGTAEAPIVLRAETPGEVVLTGESSLLIDGEHLVVSGLYFRNGKLPQKFLSTKKRDGDNPADAIKISGRNCRVTDTAVADYDCVSYVYVTGAEHRVDHCYLGDKSSAYAKLEVKAGKDPAFHQIDHNHFGPRKLERPWLYGETIWVDTVKRTPIRARVIVEHNLFDRCDGDETIIYNMTSGNIYRYNTFFESGGCLSLAGGRNCRVEGNYFIGRGKQRTGGVHITGGDHVVVNNYLEGLANAAFDVRYSGYNAGGVGPISRHSLIAFNTVIRTPEFIDASIDPVIDSADLMTPEEEEREYNRNHAADDVTVANNLYQPGQSGYLVVAEGKGWRWSGNIASPTVQSKRAHRVDALLVRGEDGLIRPLGDSPVHRAAMGDYQVPTDIDGQPRVAPYDVGCDQISDAPIENRPLTAGDVGPAWRQTNTASRPGDRPIQPADRRFKSVLVK
jgi:poly(beta-D-mannuronate) lyase